MNLQNKKNNEISKKFFTSKYNEMDHIRVRKLYTISYLYLYSKDC